MREIKFRGKRIDNGEWIVGAYIYNNNFPFILSHDVVDYDEEYIAPAFWWRVDPAAVGQYTGLKDKGGVEIYEGDICKYWMDRVWKIGYIVWHQGGFALRVFKMGERDTDEIFPFQHFIPVPRTGNVMQDQFEIIGTTHDNPELLGGAE